VTVDLPQHHGDGRTGGHHRIAADACDFVAVAFWPVVQLNAHAAADQGDWHQQT
jgi:hypothetical protein